MSRVFELSCKPTEFDQYVIANPAEASRWRQDDVLFMRSDFNPLRYVAMRFGRPVAVGFYNSLHLARFRCTDRYADAFTYFKEPIAFALEHGMSVSVAVHPLDDGLEAILGKGAIDTRVEEYHVLYESATRVPTTISVFIPTPTILFYKICASRDELAQFGETATMASILNAKIKAARSEPNIAVVAEFSCGAAVHDEFLENAKQCSTNGYFDDEFVFHTAMVRTAHATDVAAYVRTAHASVRHWTSSNVYIVPASLCEKIFALLALQPNMFGAPRVYSQHDRYPVTYRPGGYEWVPSACMRPIYLFDFVVGACLVLSELPRYVLLFILLFVPQLRFMSRVTLDDLTLSTYRTIARIRRLRTGACRSTRSARARMEVDKSRDSDN